MDTASMSTDSGVEIVVEEADDENDASNDMEGFPTDFLLARTSSFPRSTLNSQDQTMDWDSFVVASASDCPSPVEHMDTDNVEIGNQISNICKYLVDVLSDRSKYATFLRYRDSAAQDLLDLLQKLLDHAPLEQHFRELLCVALVRLCRKAGLYPRCFSLENVDVNFLEFPFSNGGFGEVYKANHNGKVIRDVASGMQYLHENGVVHGDLKSLNILVTDSQRACLADFGLSYVTDITGLRGQPFSSNHAEGGTAGFEAPELLDPDDESSRRTKASDVYAFGMVCYEMFTGERPFGRVNPVALIKKIMRGQHPAKPSGNKYQERGLTDNMWSLMESCWSPLPENRPTVAQILKFLPHFEPERQRPEEWTESRKSGFDSTDGQTTLTNALPHLRSLLL
ncbi:hypothetical protein C0992_009096 [Termitomyces sp. T32_za158]|nr:hypothetical protein C0992_009096 [Termitomyces sp. T32_za158]